MAEWIGKIAAHTESILKNILTPDQIKIVVGNEQSLLLWTKAYRHISINYLNNYEQAEIVGDAVLGSIFIQYIVMAYPGLGPGIITDMKGYYMDRYFQSKLAIKMGLDKEGLVLIRGMKVTEDSKFLSDVFEAFFGTLCTIGNDRYGFGIGYSMCFNLLVFLLKDENVSPEGVEGTEKGEINSIFNMIGVEKPVVKVQHDERSRTVTAQLTITDQKIAGFIQGPLESVIASVGSRERDVKADVYKELKRQLTAAGLTKSKAAVYKLNRVFKDSGFPEGPALLLRVVKSLPGRNFNDFVFETPPSGKGTFSQNVFLLGINTNEGTKQVIGSQTGPNENGTKVELARNIIQKYLPKA